MTKSKNLLIRQGAVYGVKHPSKMIDAGVPLNAVMNLRNTQNKRRKIVQNAKLNNFDPNTRLAIKEFEVWQQKVFKKNHKKGWRFFNPDAFEKNTPRSAREAWGGVYRSEDKVERDEKVTNRIMIGLVLLFVIVLSII